MLGSIGCDGADVGAFADGEVVEEVEGAGVPPEGGGGGTLGFTCCALRD
jgi:hypothetical protein